MKEIIEAGMNDIAAIYNREFTDREQKRGYKRVRRVSLRFNLRGEGQRVAVNVHADRLARVRLDDRLIHQIHRYHRAVEVDAVRKRVVSEVHVRRVN